jgi:hypothetical protein
MKELPTPSPATGEDYPEWLTSKPSNPKDAVGIRKVPYSTIPQGVISEVAVGMAEGAFKYGRHNYRSIGVRGSVYFDATMRHLVQWWEGEDIDPDSGLSHVSKAITSLVVLRDAMLRDLWTDDRPPRMDDGWMKDLNEKVSSLIDRYPEPAHTYTEKEDGKGPNYRGIEGSDVPATGDRLL